MSRRPSPGCASICRRQRSPSCRIAGTSYRRSTWSGWGDARRVLRRALTGAAGRAYDVQNGAVTGYSGTPLSKKLGIVAGSTFLLLGDPGHAADLLEPMPEGVRIRRRLGGSAEVILLFARDRRDVSRRLPQVWPVIFPAGAFWVCWPKKASPLWTGISEQDWRDDLLPAGLVDVKVCAVDADWSGLKFVICKELRSS